MAPVLVHHGTGRDSTDKRTTTLLLQSAKAVNPLAVGADCRQD
jgi:hypothetical protein